MSVIGHVTHVETSTFIMVFALGLACGLAAGISLGRFVYARAKRKK